MAYVLEQELRALGLTARAIWALRDAVPDASTIEDVKAGLATMSEGQFCYRPNFGPDSLKAINDVFGPWPFRKTELARSELDEKISKAVIALEGAKKSVATMESNLEMLRAKRTALDS